MSKYTVLKLSALPPYDNHDKQPESFDEQIGAEHF